MSSSSWHNATFYMQVMPISLLVTAFISLVAYVSWSLHVFNPVPLQIQMDCPRYLEHAGKALLEEYKHNRTVLNHRIGLNDSTCYSIRKRRYLPKEVPDSMEIHHHMFLLRIVSKLVKQPIRCSAYLDLVLCYDIRLIDSKTLCEAIVGGNDRMWDNKEDLDYKSFTEMFAYINKRINDSKKIPALRITETNIVTLEEEKDYDFLEEATTMMYSPLHFYCFVIDSSASTEFEKLVRALGECIMNIIVPPHTHDTSTAHGTFAALNACYVGMEQFDWKHTIVTAENEMPIHSIHYIADNARKLGEAVRIGRVTISEEHARILNGDFTLASTKEQEYLRRAVCTWLNDLRFPLTLSRSFQPTLFRFLAEQNLERCQPLSVDFDKNVALEVCHTNRYDPKGNCVVGMEDYEYTTKSRNLFVRADPNFDHGIIQCVSEFVYQRTYKNGLSEINYF